MTIPVSHLARCAKLHPSDRYACNCGADSQNERAAMLDRVEADAHSHRVGDASPETAAPPPADVDPDVDREDERADARRYDLEYDSARNVLPRHFAGCAALFFDGACDCDARTDDPPPTRPSSATRTT